MNISWSNVFGKFFLIVSVYHLSFDNEFKRSQHLILETYCIFMSFLMSTFHMSSLMLSDSLFVCFFVNLVSVEGFVASINYHSAVYH